mgnify:CR=1 FL=1
MKLSVRGDRRFGGGRVREASRVLQAPARTDAVRRQARDSPTTLIRRSLPTFEKSASFEPPASPRNQRTAAPQTSPTGCPWSRPPCWTGRRPPPRAASRSPPRAPRAGDVSGSRGREEGVVVPAAGVVRRAPADGCAAATAHRPEKRTLTRAIADSRGWSTSTDASTEEISRSHREGERALQTLPVVGHRLRDVGGGHRGAGRRSQRGAAGLGARRAAVGAGPPDHAEPWPVVAQGAPAARPSPGGRESAVEPATRNAGMLGIRRCRRGWTTLRSKPTASRDAGDARRSALPEVLHGDGKVGEASPGADSPSAPSRTAV